MKAGSGFGRVIDGAETGLVGKWEALKRKILLNEMVLNGYEIYRCEYEVTTADATIVIAGLGSGRQGLIGTGGYVPGGKRAGYSHFTKAKKAINQPEGGNDKDQDGPLCHLVCKINQTPSKSTFQILGYSRKVGGRGG